MPISYKQIGKNLNNEFKESAHITFVQKICAYYVGENDTIHIGQCFFFNLMKVNFFPTFQSDLISIDT